jgi:hypothetical protein
LAINVQQYLTREYWFGPNVVTPFKTDKITSRRNNVSIQLKRRRIARKSLAATGGLNDEVSLDDVIINKAVC